jgi:hypothetical protein
VINGSVTEQVFEFRCVNVDERLQRFVVIVVVV